MMNRKMIEFRKVDKLDIKYTYTASIDFPILPQCPINLQNHLEPLADISAR
jgi:hypothetical protein